MITLTKDQEQIKQSVVKKILEGQKEVSITGYAGTGKTELNAQIINHFSEFNKTALTLAPTGQAAHVLRSKGLNAMTVHSAIYYFKGIYKNDNNKSVISWKKRDDLKEIPSVIIVDESSLIDVRLAKDLRSFNIPIVWVGDNGQLPPIYKSANVLDNSQHSLVDVIRNEGNILDYATKVRNGQDPEFIKTEDLNVYSYQAGDLLKIIDLYDNDTQVVAAFRKTKNSFNKTYRKVKGHKGLISKGEKILCTKNTPRYDIYNGTQMYVKNILSEDALQIKVEVETDEKNIIQIPISKQSIIDGDKFDFDKLQRGEVPVDYAYSITCHKAMGSEWDDVFVLYEPRKRFIWDKPKWLYTASTRAKKKLTVVRRVA